MDQSNQRQIPAEDCFQQKDRDELLKHGWQLENINTTLKDIQTTAREISARADNKSSSLEMKVDTQVKTIEQRLTSLEQFKWVAAGGGAAVGTILGLVMSLWALLKR